MTARILIVDDMPANTRLLETKLTAEYYQVATAHDGSRPSGLPIPGSRT
jgi:two-component system cell cycle response regulator